MLDSCLLKRWIYSLNIFSLSSKIWRNQWVLSRSNINHSCLQPQSRTTRRPYKTNKLMCATEIPVLRLTNLNCWAWLIISLQLNPQKAMVSVQCPGIPGSLTKWSWPSTKEPSRLWTHCHQRESQEEGAEMKTSLVHAPKCTSWSICLSYCDISSRTKDTAGMAVAVLPTCIYMEFLCCHILNSPVFLFPVRSTSSDNCSQVLCLSCTDNPVSLTIPQAHSRTHLWECDLLIQGQRGLADRPTAVLGNLLTCIPLTAPVWGMTSRG